MQNQIRPNKYIKKLPQYQQYECKICYEMTDSPMRCAGPCKAVFCQHCITFTKNARDKCPLRCSDTFNVEPIPHLHIEYDCPFQSQQCKIIIKSRAEFYYHYLHCKQVPQNYLQQIQKKKRYLCNNGHRLCFLNKYVFQKIYEQQTYQKVYRLKCVGCGEEGTCPSICFNCTTQECKAVYCVDCRSIPCCTFECPLGHILFGKNVSGFIGLKNSQICHMCGVLPALVGQRVYFDTLCGLVLCMICRDALPRQNELIPLKHQLYDEQQRPYDLSLAAFKRDQQIAQRQLLEEIMAQRQQKSSSEQESSEDDNSVSSQRMRRFFSGERIRHSSSEQQDSDEQGNSVQVRRALLQHLVARLNHQENASTGQELSQRHQNHSQSHPSSLRENHQQQQDQFFSIDSEPENRQQQEQFFLCQSQEKQPPENIQRSWSQAKPKGEGE